MFETICVEMFCSKHALVRETGQHWKKTSTEDHTDAYFFVWLDPLLTVHYSKRCVNVSSNCTNEVAKWLMKSTLVGEKDSVMLARQKFELSSSLNLVNADRNYLTQPKELQW